MEIVAATNNRNKLEELRRFLQAAGHKVLSMGEAGVMLEPDETGETFAENAKIKAVAVCKACGLPTLGDDSGLCVEALNGAPGILSARFSGIPGDDEANNAKLMRLLERFPYAKRGARFVCALALAMPGGAVLEVEGQCEGRIGLAPSGEGGFGYDPLFYYDNESFADMTQERKDEVSHRAVAMKRLLEEMPAFVAQNS